MCFFIENLGNCQEKTVKPEELKRRLKLQYSLSNLICKLIDL